MKKGISVLLAGILMISLTACQRDVSKRIFKKYQDLESYRVTADVTVHGNKGSSVYEMNQSYRAPDSYRVDIVKPEHLVGTTSVSTEGKLRLKRDDRVEEIQLFAGREETDILFPDGLLREFLARDPLPELTEGEDGTILLTGVIANGNSYRMSQNLMLDGKSLLPKRLITYNKDGDEVFRVEYRDFELNAKIEDGAFVP